MLHCFVIFTEGSRNYHMEGKCLCFKLYLVFVCVCVQERESGEEREREVGGRKRVCVFMEVRGQLLRISSHSSIFTGTFN